MSLFGHHPSLIERFTWRHVRHIATPKQWEVFFFKWTFFLCKNFVLFQQIYIAAGLVNENTLLYIINAIKRNFVIITSAY